MATRRQICAPPVSRRSATPGTFGNQLLGNRHLHRERAQIYQALAHWLLVGVERPVILVDWPDCEPGHAGLMLTAALSASGRPYHSPRTYQRFLQPLPDCCRPILVTDAGFRGPWFGAVAQLGWMRHFQANTQRRRAVWSLFFLGREVFRHPAYTVEYAALMASLNWLRTQLQIQAFPV